VARGESGVATDGGEASKEAEALKRIEDALMGIGGESMASQELLKHIVTRVTDEGLVIELFDVDGSPLFAGSDNMPTEILRDLAQMLVTVTSSVTNSAAVEAHVRTMPIVLANNPVWEVSSTRANQMRTLLTDYGMAQRRIVRVTGHADRKPAVANAMAIRNNRIEVILLRTVR